MHAIIYDPRQSLFQTSIRLDGQVVRVNVETMTAHFEDGFQARYALAWGNRAWIDIEGVGSFSLSWADLRKMNRLTERLFSSEEFSKRVEAMNQYLNDTAFAEPMA